jgi:hypothetical protein
MLPMYGVRDRTILYGHWTPRQGQNTPFIQSRWFSRNWTAHASLDTFVPIPKLFYGIDLTNSCALARKQWLPSQNGTVVSWGFIVVSAWPRCIDMLPSIAFPTRELGVCAGNGRM